MIQVGDIRFNGKRNGNFLTYVSAVIDRWLVLKHMRLAMSKKDGGKFVLSMPAKQNADYEWIEIYHPITPWARKALEDAIFAAYLKIQSEAKVEAGSV